MSSSKKGRKLYDPNSPPATSARLYGQKRSYATSDKVPSNSRTQEKGSGGASKAFPPVSSSKKVPSNALHPANKQSKSSESPSEEETSSDQEADSKNNSHEEYLEDEEVGEESGGGDGGSNGDETGDEAGSESDKDGSDEGNGRGGQKQGTGIASGRTSEGGSKQPKVKTKPAGDSDIPSLPGLDLGKLSVADRRQLLSLISRIQTDTSSPSPSTSSHTGAPSSSSKAAPSRQKDAKGRKVTDSSEKLASHEASKQTPSKPQEKHAVNSEEASESESESGGTDANPIKDVVLASLLRAVMRDLTGFEKMYEVQAPAFDSNRKSIYWVATPTGQKLRPHWEESFKQNWAAWGDELVRGCGDTETMAENVEYLSRVTRRQIKKHFQHVTWKSYVRAWKDKQAESDKRTKKNIKSAVRNRTTAKVEVRSQAAEGTFLKNLTYAFMFQQEFQSPEASDAEDSHKAVIDDPRWHSDILQDLLDALAQKARAERSRVSSAKKDNQVYIHVDTPLPSLLNGIRMPRWAIDYDWYKANPEKIKEMAFVIDKKAKDVPQDVIDFIDEYGKRSRAYVDKRPQTAKPRMQTSSRSVSPAVSLRHSSVTPAHPTLLIPNTHPTAPIDEDSIDPTLEGGPASSLVPDSSVLSGSRFNLQLDPQASSRSATELAAEYAAQSAVAASTSSHSFDSHAVFNPHPGPPMPPPFNNPEPQPSEQNNPAEPPPDSGTRKRKGAKGKGTEDKAKKRKHSRKDPGEETLEEDPPIESSSGSKKKANTGVVKRLKLVGKGH